MNYFVTNVIIHGQGHGRRGGGDPRPGGVGGKNFSAAFGGRKIYPWGPAPGKGGWSKIFLPGGVVH